MSAEDIILTAAESNVSEISNLKDMPEQVLAAVNPKLFIQVPSSSVQDQIMEDMVTNISWHSANFQAANKTDRGKQAEYLRLSPRAAAGCTLEDLYELRRETMQARGSEQLLETAEEIQDDQDDEVNKFHLVTGKGGKYCSRERSIIYQSFHQEARIKLL